jgi:hypothetical protein
VVVEVKVGRDTKNERLDGCEIAAASEGIVSQYFLRVSIDRHQGPAEEEKRRTESK